MSRGKALAISAITAIMISFHIIFGSATAQHHELPEFAVEAEKSTYRVHGNGISLRIMLSLSPDILVQGAEPTVEVISPNGVVKRANLQQLEPLEDYYVLTYSVGINEENMALGGYKIVASYREKFEAEGAFLLKPEYPNQLTSDYNLTQPISVHTDKKVYAPQSEMTISGVVNGTLPVHKQLLLRVIEANSKDVYVQEVPIDEENGTFSYTVKPEDAPAKEGGYGIRAEIHDKDSNNIKYVDETIVFIVTEETFLSCYNDFICKYNFAYQNNTYPIIYAGHERIINVSINEQEKSLTIDIAGNSDFLYLAVPTNLVQSISSGSKIEQNYTVFVDEIRVDYEEQDRERSQSEPPGIWQWVNNPQETRAMVIRFSENSHTIKIIGTTTVADLAHLQ